MSESPYDSPSFLVLEKLDLQDYHDIIMMINYHHNGHNLHHQTSHWIIGLV